MVDLVNELATQLHAKVEPVEVQWPTAVLSLKRGDCDFFGGSLVYNPGRALEVAFAKPFWAKGLNMVVPVKNPKNLQHLSDLNSENITIAAVVRLARIQVLQAPIPEGEVPCHPGQHGHPDHRSGPPRRRRRRGAADHHHPMVAAGPRERRMGQDGLPRARISATLRMAGPSASAIRSGARLLGRVLQLGGRQRLGAETLRRVPEEDEPVQPLNNQSRRRG